MLDQITKVLVMLCGSFFCFQTNLNVFAASLEKVELVPDGSVKPPGDAIYVSLLLEPGEPGIELEVRPYLISGEKNEIMTEVRSRGEQNRDANGLFLLKKKLQYKLRRTSIIRTKLVVPYEELAIEVGKHQLGYEVRGLNESQGVIFRTATRLSTVQITKETRTSMEIKDRRPKLVEKTRSDLVKGFVYLPEDKDFSPLEWPASDYVPVTETPFEKYQVNIPGEYERTLKQLPEPVINKSNEKNQINLLQETPWTPLKKRVIYFATNRNVVKPSSKQLDRFGDDLAREVSYGSALVNIPSNHKRGDLELPTKILWWEIRDPEEHFYVEILNPLEKEDFIKSLVGKNDILLFVHGYRNSMKDACLRFAQVVHDIQFPGKPVLFIWPSAGKFADYKRDERMAEKSDESLAEVILALANKMETTDDAKIHIIAHSMGNRILLRSIDRASKKLADKDVPFGHVILAAPDVDLRTFIRTFPAVSKRAETINLYFNPLDAALKASRVVHFDSRVGEAAVFYDPLYNIDAKNADTSILGHGYYATKDILLVDIQLLINHSLRPPRPTIRKKNAVSGHIYWAFP